MLGILTSCTDTQKETAMEQNETLENLKTRRAVRSYQDRMPEMELIEKVVEAGTYAPTGMGRQSPIIVAVTDKAVRDRIARLNAGVMGGDKDPFYGAPVVLVVLADRNVPTHVYDGALVMGNLLNAAAQAGLGSCWVCNFDVEKFRSGFGLPPETAPVAIVPVGYAASEPDRPSERKPLDEIVTYF